ncbi:MAG: hypothetical protein CSA35_04260 [Dethiosulfovibrio peptidovorans]|nr:MAG: hypothetical protein CSA35_04260 [Dethiosulfovibrio peptidovorans]
MNNLSTHECYFRLGLPPGASWSQVKAAFRRLARQTHPDVAGRSARDFERISEAYMLLRDQFRSGIAQETPSKKRRFCPDFRRFFEPLLRVSVWISQTVEDVRRRRKERREIRDRRRQKEDARRFRLMDQIIGDGEIHIETILARLNKSGGISERQRLIRRLESPLPEVRGLAFQGLSTFLVVPEVAAAVEECLSRYGLDEFGVDAVVSIADPLTGLRLATSAAPHFRSMTVGVARRYLKWLKSLPGGLPVYAGLPDPISGQVVGLLLAEWPKDLPFPSGSRLQSLLNREEDEVLIPLLRGLYRREYSGPLLPWVERLSKNSSSPAVKAWAHAIVCRSAVV